MVKGIEIYYKNTENTENTEKSSGNWYDIVSISYEDELASVFDSDGDEIVTIPFSMISNLRVKQVNKKLA